MAQAWIAVALCSLTSAQTSAQVVADSVAQFSGTQGASGWSYGYQPGASGIFTPLPAFGVWPGVNANDPVWYFAFGGTPNDANTNLSATGGHPQLDQGPPGREHFAVRRWTVPATAVYRVSGLFGDYTPDFGHGTHDGVLGQVLLGDWPLWSESTTGTTPDSPYVVEHAMPTGATLDFVVGPKGTQHNDQFTFTAVIEIVRTCVPDLSTTANPFVPGFGVPDGTLNNEDFFF